MSRKKNIFVGGGAHCVHLLFLVDPWRWLEYTIESG